jgi:hypothetical protein
MCRIIAYVLPLLLLICSVSAAEESKQEGDKLLSGMSIVGNDEAPKSLVIVPWKTSDMGDGLDVSRMLDDGRQPVDRDVFMRALDYYEIREGKQPGPASLP